MLYVYNYIFAVNGFDDMLVSSGIVLQCYFLWYWSSLRLNFFVHFLSQQEQNFINVGIFKLIFHIIYIEKAFSGVSEWFKFYERV